MLVTLKEIMKIAEENSYAAGSFNVPNLESLLAVVSAAEELKLPVIIQHAQCHESIIPLSVIGQIMVERARKAAIPVCVHLDHGETVEYLQKAVDIGFTSVMFDGSALSYEKNVELTRETVAMASVKGASVEAELGSMGRREAGGGDMTGENDESKIYTDPVQAKQFVEDTGIDALACSFGTTHGIYLTRPKLDFSIVERVRKETGGIPVVMHGGSGVSREDFRSAIRAGVRKINYFTYMDKAGGKAAGDFVKKTAGTAPVFFTDIAAAAMEATKEDVKTAMKVFGMKEE